MDGHEVVVLAHVLKCEVRQDESDNGWIARRPVRLANAAQLSADRTRPISSFNAETVADANGPD